MTPGNNQGKGSGNLSENQRRNSSLDQDAQRILCQPHTCPGNNQPPWWPQCSSPFPAVVHALFISVDLGPARHLLWQEVYMKSNQDLLICCTQIIGACLWLNLHNSLDPPVFLANAFLLVFDFASTVETLAQLHSRSAML